MKSCLSKYYFLYCPSFHCNLNSQKVKNCFTIKKKNSDFTIGLSFFPDFSLERVLFIFHSKLMRINNLVHGKLSKTLRRKLMLKKKSKGVAP